MLDQLSAQPKLVILDTMNFWMDIAMPDLLETIKMVDLILVNDGELANSLDKNIPIIRLNRHNKYSLRTMHKCVKILRNYELIHVHMRHNYRYIQLIKRVFFVKTKVILHDHYGNIDIDKSVPFGLRSILKPTYYIGVSKTLLSWASNKLKLPQSYFVLYNSSRTLVI